MSRKMLCSISLDWCDYTCPCGASISTKYMSDASVKSWIDEHKPHTDGTCHETTNSDGQRAWGGGMPDEITDL